jgi:hypothetical protein
MHQTLNKLGHGNCGMVWQIVVAIQTRPKHMHANDAMLWPPVACLASLAIASSVEGYDGLDFGTMDIQPGLFFETLFSPVWWRYVFRMQTRTGIIVFVGVYAYAAYPWS